MAVPIRRNASASACGATPMAKPRCRSARSWPSGKTLTSAVGYSLNYNTLDNNRDPTDGLLVEFRQDFAGLGGDVNYLRSAIDAKYYIPLVADIVGIVHLQGGILTKVGSDLRMLDHFQMGPNLVRGFAPNGIGPRDINPFGTRDALGGTQILGRFVRTADAVLVPAQGSRSEGCRSMPMPARSGTTRDRPAGRDRRSQRARLHAGRPLRRLQVPASACSMTTERRSHLGRCRLDLGVAVRSAALRLCGAADQGPV